MAITTRRSDRIQHVPDAVKHRLPWRRPGRDSDFLYISLEIHIEVGRFYT